MASSSNSSLQKRFKYDVFLSFRGEDTRKNFVDHLYHALKDKGIYTYKDDEKIQKGKRISDDLIKSIKDSKFYIIVFSKNYASSSWCLEELVKIMESHKMTGHTAYPVFYDVEPTEIRKQSGAVGEAFAKHEKEMAVGKWKEALKEAADLAGWELKNTNDGHEAKFIKKVVQEISLELRSINSGFDEKLVGMETRLKDVVSSLEIGIDEVRMIGIKGMGGAGKTTTTRAVFDHLSNHFEAVSFVKNVREVATGSGLQKLQVQVLSDVLNKQVTVHNVDDGKDMMKKRMCGKKVLLVLDDVDHIDQLEALASKDWFKCGSRIIITTRDEQVLVAHKVHLIRDINLLSDNEAICLFSRYAFGRENPLQGYEELSGKVVSYAAGLPLTVKVLGSFLCGKDRVEWVDAIERLEKIPLKETMEKLELSYIGLEDDYKEIFLDIACILKGVRKEYAISILESRGFHAINGLKVLEQRSLITIINSNYDHTEYLGMHDHIEEMGRNIVRREHPDEPNKHSRLWIKEEIEDILDNDMGTEATRCLKLEIWSGNARIFLKGLEKMKKLQYLEVDYQFKMKKLQFLGVNFSYYISSLPNSLKYLKCWNYPFLHFPKTFQNNLVGLEMYDSSMVQLWKKGEKKVLKKLKFLSLHRSKLTTYDFRITPNLETLYLNDSSCILKELCMPTSSQKLTSLHISGSRIRTFDLGLTPNMERLSLRNSLNLIELFMPVSCQKLTCLHISGSRIRTFDLGLTPNMERLSLRKNPNLIELFMPVSCQKLKHLDIYDPKLRTFHLGLTPNLETLSLDYCADLEELHVSVACPNLKSLSLSGTRLRSLDLELIPNLERLDLNNCAVFVELQVSAPCTNLKFLNLCNLRLRSLDLELIPNLERLDLKNCNKLVEINAPIGCLKKVGYLNLSGCLRFNDFVFHGSSEPKVSCSSATLDLVGESLNLCPLHPNSNLPKLRFGCYYAEDLPSSVGNIEKLTSFGLCACTDLKKFSDLICSLQFLQKLTLRGNIPEFPKDLGQLECLKSLTVGDGDLPDKLPDDLVRLECLEELCLHSSEIKHLPDSICMLKRLKSLRVNNGYYFEDLFERLPEDLGQLECLEELYVSSKKIEYLPDSICMLRRLKSLNFSGCCRLGKLPEDIGRLESLESLDLWGTAIKHLPDSVCLLKHLKLLDVAHCWCLGKLPKYIGHLESLERLDVSSTEITHLPDSICNLKHLNYLNLENCPLLEELPEDLGRLECLEEIWPQTLITRMKLSSELL